jgi:hypothetical protein
LFESFAWLEYGSKTLGSHGTEEAVKTFVSSRGMNFGRWMLLLLIAFTLYLGSYFCIMTRTMPAQSSPGVPAFSSSSRFAELYTDDVNGVHVYYPGPTFANYLFWPIDFVLDRAGVGQSDPE